MFVDSGIGHEKVSLKDFYSKGDIVIDQCFDAFVGAQVNTKDYDGWTGVFELSTDGKSNYVLLILFWLHWNNQYNAHFC